MRRLFCFYDDEGETAYSYSFGLAEDSVDSKLASMTAHPLKPALGDIFIARSSSGPDKYDLGIVSGPPQMVVSGRQAATILACELGRRKVVDVWSTEDYESYLLLVRHRATLDPRDDIIH